MSIAQGMKVSTNLTQRDNRLQWAFELYSRRTNMMTPLTSPVKGTVETPFPTLDLLGLSCSHYLATQQQVRPAHRRAIPHMVQHAFASVKILEKSNMYPPAPGPKLR